MFRPEKGVMALTLAIQMMDSHEIRQLIRQGAYEFSMHAQLERLAEELDVTEVEEAIAQGEILESYPHDPRGESCLMVGYTGTKPIHAVLGWAKVRGTERRILRVITVYIPQPPKWSDPRTRRGRP
jgi:hypothetical protein